ncbi:hypothetical protein [Streptomyces sp. NPDC005209]|uniref:hypothetical protein n=1 Tax=Streptomyces sp. NPDC005209 TaxID=3156715 RepID=UPI0033A81939
MRITSSGGGPSGIPILWELDEHLSPIRRIGTASGLQRLPSGILQMRTSGKWEIENRDRQE